PGTAAPGSDYVPVTNTFQFVPRQVTGSFTVPIVDDGVVEPVETVRLLLTNAVGAAPGVWPQAQLSILDGSGNGPFSLYPPILLENGPGVGVLVVRGGATNLPLTLYYNARDGTAVAGLGYQPLSGVFQLAPGERSGYIQGTPINDSIQEGPQDFVLEIRETPDGPLAGSVSITIVDNEFGLGFDVTEVSAFEFLPEVAVHVQCLWDPAAPVQVDYTTRDIGQAKAGLDYLPRS